MRAVQSDETPAYSSMALPWQADGIWLISDPATLRAHLDDLPPQLRRDTHIAGELTNTVVAERVPGRVVLFRGGHATDATPGPGRAVTLRIDASRALDAVVADATVMGLRGIELLSGIPGTVGGAVVQNAGAYGQAISDVFVRAVAYDKDRADVVTLGPEDLRFGYRTSALKATRRYSPDLVLLTVVLRLHRDPPEPITYEDLARHHASLGRSALDLQARRTSVLEVRARKGMVVDGENWRSSVGSFFVGPTVPREVAASIATRVRGERFARRLLQRHRPDRDVARLPAALALRAAGLLNGDHWGAVGLSDRHILALHNRGGATGSDVLAVSGLVRRRVRAHLGIDLEREAKVLGEFETIDLDDYEAAHPLHRGAGEPAWVRATGDDRSDGAG